MPDYTGLGALAWAQFSADEPGPDQRFFQGIIEQQAGPALEVGCGTGRLLIPYLMAGLVVDGIDPSEDMLAICRSKAAARGLIPQLSQQEMQHLDLARSYHTILILAELSNWWLNAAKSSRPCIGFMRTSCQEGCWRLPSITAGGKWRTNG